MMSADIGDVGDKEVSRLGEIRVSALVVDVRLERLLVEIELA